jgi:hypothetical protein
VDSLLDKMTKSQVSSTLEGLRTGADALDSAYSEAMERIEGQMKGKRLLAKQALSWISYAQRPLTVPELCNALAIQPGTKVLDHDEIYDMDDILSVCAGLIIVDNESNIVRLVHYTTQEYFDRIRLKWNPHAEQDIASACITYLSMDVFVHGSCDSDEAFEARLRDNIFLDYSAQHWGKHAKEIQQAISGLALPFLCHEPFALAAIQVARAKYHRSHRDSQSYPRQTNGLHLVALYGLTCLAEMLLKESGNFSSADSKDGAGRTPLSYAAENGHEAVVRLLVEREDVEADSEDRLGRTPLSSAARNGHEAVVRLLVEREDVEADSKDRFNGTPLSCAAENGHEAIVRLLVEREDVEADSKDGVGQTPLAYAAENGHEAVVRLLVEREDVEADSKDSFGKTPLSYAAESGHEAVVRLLE